jgi:23S rRNA (cytosine1962-C5)-methyltransferase
MSSSLPVLRLKRGEDRRVRHGHPWIYSNEIDTAQTPLAAFQPGAAATVVDARDEAIGTAYVNPHSLITARLLTRRPDAILDRELIAERLRVALRLRERLYATPHYRLVFGESDNLPGLVLDRYGDVVVGQIATAGMEALRGEIEAAVADVLRPSALVWRNTGASRSLERLPEYVEAGIGELPETLDVREGDLRFRVPLEAAQKTGWFYDQQANRDLFARLGQGSATVLDVFAYQGGWGLRAATSFAQRVLCVDTSRASCEAIEANAALNGMSDRVDSLHADAFEALKALREEGQRFDAVVLDPPAFIKRRKDHKEGLTAYKRINQQAMKVLAPDGLLVSCSCSHHLAEEELLAAIHEAAIRTGRHATVLARLQQSPDHPVHPAIRETAYLKGFICRIA